jgi:hypothetical protein
MRSLYTGGLLLGVALICVGRTAADAQSDARAIIDKAIKAHGGEATLAKFKAQTWKEKGNYYGQGNALPYTGNYAVQWPDQFRMEIEGIFTVVLNGDKGWVKQQNETKEMTPDQLAGQKGDMYGGWVSTLLPLKDKAYGLTTLSDIKVNDRPAAGVKVTHKGRPDVELYFDKSTGLLSKAVFPVKSPEQQGKEVKQEVFHSNYKDFSGMQIPTKILIHREGKIFVEAENSDVKPAEKLDGKVFAKP